MAKHGPLSTVAEQQMTEKQKFWKEICKKADKAKKTICKTWKIRDVNQWTVRTSLSPLSFILLQDRMKRKIIFLTC